jgi:coniferyl-aldehyde dehydrogenase
LARAHRRQLGRKQDYSAEINDRQHLRIQGLLDDARAKGGRVTVCGQPSAGRQMPLHVVTGCTNDMRVMKEEIFGPILAVVPYDTLDEVVAQVQSRPRPLAMYCFSHDAAEREDLLRRTHAGGVTINDWGWHLINHDAPFGGVGNSGMGNYHGEEGFRKLSHAKTVFKRHRFFPIGLFYPPYGNAVQRLVLKVFVGDADPSVAMRAGRTSRMDSSSA